MEYRIGPQVPISVCEERVFGQHWQASPVVHQARHLIVPAEGTSRLCKETSIPNSLEPVDAHCFDILHDSVVQVLDAHGIVNVNLNSTAREEFDEDIAREESATVLPISIEIQSANRLRDCHVWLE